MKSSILTLLLIILSQFLFAFTVDSSKDLTSEKNQKIKKYENEVNEIYNMYKHLRLETLDYNYDVFSKLIKELESDNNSYNMEEIETYVNRFKFYHSLKQEEELTLDRISTDYFDLSTKVFRYNIRVQNLFTSERGSGAFYGGIENQTQNIIIKKHLYEAGMLAYNQNMLLVKNSKPCDYTERIELLNENLSLLMKMEKILLADHTRDLEKSLKNELDVEKIKELIYEYSIN